jgi:hypothetical protein
LPLFKSSDQLLSAGTDLLLRRDIVGAWKRFLDAREKFAKEGNTAAAQLAAAYATVVKLGVPPVSVTDYAAAMGALGALGATDMRLGVRDVSASSLSTEVRAEADNIDLSAMRPTTPEMHAEMARRYQALSLSYRQLGDANLVLPEMFRGQTIRASSRAPQMAALAEQHMGEAVVNRNPKEAASHYQNARNWWLQAGNADNAQFAAGTVSKYGRSVRCWFCGDEVAGEGVQFNGIPTDLSTYVPDPNSESSLPRHEPTTGTVFACRPCGTAIDNIADFRAKQRAGEVEMRLQAQIEDLKRRMQGRN